MIRKFLLIPLLLTLLIGQGKVPNVRLKMLDGKYAKLYDLLKDGPMIIDFWATWCEPCKKQMHHLNKFHKHFKDTGFRVLTINTDTPKSMGKVKSYIRSKKFEFMVAVDPNNQVMKKMRVKLMPTTILVDTDGTIIYRHQGYLPGDERDILKHITDYFDKSGIAYEPLNFGESKNKNKKEKIEVDF
ncbi:TlpA disulfide reductase family protein [Candidatus Marinimicrobia bacterium]|nr:TlpA disulfide reductase family protein [Candidatus Neomarinimicrobiota bacterium]